MENKYGIEYNKPEVILMQDTGIGAAEFAGRTAYDSFENSENDCISRLNNAIETEDLISASHYLDKVNNIEHSELLDTLAWTYFHHSVLEHANLTFLIKGTSRGVLQELARHRIASYTVRSTRYTMSSIINAFIASVFNTPEVSNSTEWFITKMFELDLLVTTDAEYNRIEYRSIFAKLLYQMNTIGREEFKRLAVAKSSLDYVDTMSGLELYKALENGKKKRNIGDFSKHVVTDNWKVDLVMTMNLRSLKNFFTLRDSGAAYFQIQWLAQEMKKVTPEKYLDLIIHKNRNNNE